MELHKASNQLSRVKFLLFVLLSLLVPLPGYAQDLDWASRIIVSPAQPKVGGEVTFQMTVRAGRFPARGFSIVGGIDGQRQFRQSIPPLEARSRHRLTFKWKATRGSHTAFFQIVSKRGSGRRAPRLTRAFSVQTAATPQVASPQRSQARKRPAPTQLSPLLSPQHATPAGTQQPVCEGTPLPDLVAKNLTVDGSGLPGDPHTITVSVVNHGQCASGRFAIKAYVRIQGQGVDKVEQLGSKGAPSLEPCRSDTCSEASYSTVFNFVPQYNHAYYDFTVEVDSGNNVNEFSENNNEVRNDLSVQVY